jgi:hypothetical protein
VALCGALDASFGHGSPDVGGLTPRGQTLFIMERRMSYLSRTLVGLALGGTLTACAHGSSHGAEPSHANVITRAEMEQNQYASLYEVVQALRGRWLNSRGPTTLLGKPTEVQVMVDDLRLGGVNTLRSLTRDNVVTIAFVDPVTAAQRWGGKYAQGTIVVTTRADGAPDAEPQPQSSPRSNQ